MGNIDYVRKAYSEDLENQIKQQMTESDDPFYLILRLNLTVAGCSKIAIEEYSKIINEIGCSKDELEKVIKEESEKIIEKYFR